MDNKPMSELLALINEINKGKWLYTDIFLNEARSDGKYFSEKTRIIEYGGEIPGDGYFEWSISYPEFFDQRISGYISQVYKSIDELPPENFSDDKIYRYLLKSIHSLNFYKESIDGKIAHVDLSDEQIEIGQQLSKSISNLIRYLQGKLDILNTKQSAPLSNNPEVISQVNKRKIQVNLTVQQIACIARIAYEIKLIDHSQHKTEIFAALSDTFSSKKRSEVSEKSIKEHFYKSILENQVDPAIYQDIFDIIQKMKSYLVSKK